LRDINKFKENNLSYSINIFYLALIKNDKKQTIRKLNLLHILEYNYQREYIVDLILFTEGKKNLKNHHNINKIPSELNMYYYLINRENR